MPASSALYALYLHSDSRNCLLKYPMGLVIPSWTCVSIAPSPPLIGGVWHFLESECDPEERELVRDFLLPTAAALALSLPQVRLAYHLFFSMQYCELNMMTDNSF